MRDLEQYNVRKKDGTVVNEAAGLNPDGSRNVLLTGSNGAKATVNEDGSVSVKIAGSDSTGVALPVTIQGAESGNGALDVNVESAEATMPIDFQAVYNVSDTQLSAKAIGAGAWDTTAAYLDVKEFSKIAVKVKSEASDVIQVDLYWSEDQTNVDYVQTIFTGTGQFFGNVFPTLGSFVKTAVRNGGAASHTYDAKIQRKTI